jgi:hypothetical protein
MIVRLTTSSGKTYYTTPQVTANTGPLLASDVAADQMTCEILMPAGPVGVVGSATIPMGFNVVEFAELVLHGGINITVNMPGAPPSLVMHLTYGDTPDGNTITITFTGPMYSSSASGPVLAAVAPVPVLAVVGRVSETPFADLLKRINLLH